MIHQGKILNEICKKLNYPVVKMAGDIGVTREYAYKLMKSVFISSEVIEKFCAATSTNPAVFFTQAKPKDGITILILKGVYHFPDVGETIIPSSAVLSVQSFSGGR